MDETSEKKEEVIYPEDYAPTVDIPIPDPKARNQLLHLILSSAPEEIVDTDLFAVMEKRRSTRKFLDKWVAPSKVD
ncbi:MAG: nitroreductase, partial [Nitrosopumilaceae archaeon]